MRNPQKHQKRARRLVGGFSLAISLAVVTQFFVLAEPAWATAAIAIADVSAQANITPTSGNNCSTTLDSNVSVTVVVQNPGDVPLVNPYVTVSGVGGGEFQPFNGSIPPGGVHVYHLTIAYGSGDDVIGNSTLTVHATNGGLEPVATATTADVGGSPTNVSDQVFKCWANQVAEITTYEGFGLGLLALAIPGVAVAAGVAAAVIGLVCVAATIAGSHDPPDPNYTTFALPDPPTPPTLPSGLTAKQTADFTQLFSNLDDIVGQLRALSATIDKMWGADNAQSTYWHDQQLTQASQYAQQVEQLSNEAPGLFAAVENDFGAAEFSSSFSPTLLETLQGQIATGNDSGLKSELAQVGATSDEVSVAESTILSLDTSLSGTVVVTQQNQTFSLLSVAMSAFASWASNGLASALPVITGISPPAGTTSGGDTVTVSGTGLAGVTGIQFGPSNPGFNVSCSDTSCTVTTPPGVAGTVGVIASSPGGPSAPTPADEFLYQQAPLPVVSSVSPAFDFVPGGAATVTVSGANLSQVSEIDFGSAGAGTNLGCGDTSCTVTDPSSSTTGVVEVTAVSPSGTSAITPSDEFTYLPIPPPPTVTSISPNSGSEVGGTAITVNGTNLLGATQIAFGDYFGTVQSCNSTSCTVSSPQSGSTGPVDVVVTTPGGMSTTSPSDQFTFLTPPLPVVDSISPTSGSTLGGDEITLTGSNLTGASEVDFGTTSDFNFSCSSDTSCQVQDPAGTPGPTDVTVITPGGQSTDSPGDVFTYIQAPPPAVTQLSESGGPYTGGYQVTLTGTNLTPTTEVDFGSGNPAAISICTDTYCTVTAPAGTPGTVQVTANGPAGTSATTMATEFTYSDVGLSQYQLPSDVSGNPGHLAAGNNGDLWFTDPTASEVGTISPDGNISEFPTPSANSYPDGITNGSDGRMWYVEQATDKLVAVSSGGTQTEYPVSQAKPNDLLGLVSGPDGRLWFTMVKSGEIGAMTTSGSVSYYPLSNSGAFPRNITVGPDGRLWFTEYNSGAIGAVTTGGQITEYPLSNSSSAPWGITSGPDGRVWFTESGTNEIGAITTDGQLTEYPVPVSTVDYLENPLVGITAGSDGQLWFGAAEADSVGSISTSGQVSEFGTPGPDAPSYIIQGADEAGHSTFWFTEDGSGAIGKLTTGGPVLTPPTIMSLSAFTGPSTGGTQVVITGSGFTGATNVQFGGADSAFTVVNDNQIDATTPKGSLGYADLSITTPGGSTILRDAFLYMNTSFGIATTSLQAATRGATYGPVTLQVESEGLSTSPYVTTVKWKKVALPRGMKLSKAGVLSGAPNHKLTPGSTSVTVQATETVTTLNGKKKVKTKTTVEATIPLTLN